MSKETQAPLPFGLVCDDCDIDGPDSFESAALFGWTDVYADDGLTWNHLGTCPDCLRWQNENYRQLKKRNDALAFRRIEP